MSLEKIRSNRKLTNSALDYTLGIAISLLPVLLFLLTLVFLDSYKLVKLRTLIGVILVGCLGAVASLPINGFFLRLTKIEPVTYARFCAPIVEEVLKSLYLLYLIRARKLGFIVDAAITGFAVGAGFALVENAYYVKTLGDSGVVTWIVRGFGTAVMHGAATAVFAMISKDFFDRRERKYLLAFLPGFFVAIIVHSFYNHFLLSPLASTVVIHITFPLVILAAFYRSERATRLWLGSQFDTDTELLDIINSGQVSNSKIGQIFKSVAESFPPEVVVDMLCYLKLRVELAISAKGILLMREAGFDPPLSPAIKDSFDELRHLEKSIGKTGRLAVLPLIHTSSRDLWQLHMLEKT